MNIPRQATRSIVLSLLPCAAFLAGCGSPSYQRVPFAAVDQPIPAGRGRVVVLRSDQLAGSSRPIYVRSGGREIGRLASNDYLSWLVAPGKKVIDVVFDRPLIDGADLEGIGAVEVEEGGTTYVEVVLQDAPELSAEKSRVGLPIVVPLSDSEGARRVAAAQAAPVDTDR